MAAGAVASLPTTYFALRFARKASNVLLLAPNDQAQLEEYAEALGCGKSACKNPNCRVHGGAEDITTPLLTTAFEPPVGGVQKAEDRTYIAGPMTGYPEWNEPAFRAMAARLRSLGLEVVSPNELHAPSDDVPWDWYLRRDLAALATCNRVVFLPGWERSKGARLEHHVAEALGMELVYPGDHDVFFYHVRWCVGRGEQ